MLSAQDNEFLTRVGPGTPMGDLLRRYWTPALLVSEVPTPAGDPVPQRLRVVLLQIGLMDLSLSIDNVIAAVGLAPKTHSGDPVMWPIYAGVLIAILALQQIAPHAVNLLKKYPILEPTAFVLIGYVGILLIGAIGFGIERALAAVERRLLHWAGH